LYLCHIHRLEFAITKVLVASVSVHFLRLDLLVDQPQCMNMARDITENCQANIDDQITRASSYESSSCRREQYRNQDENDIRAFDHLSQMKEYVATKELRTVDITTVVKGTMDKYWMKCPAPSNSSPHAQNYR